jgi:hypothetical protein
LALDMLTDTPAHAPGMRAPLLSRLRSLLVRARHWLFG